VACTKEVFGDPDPSTEAEACECNIPATTTFVTTTMASTNAASNDDENEDSDLDQTTGCKNPGGDFLFQLLNRNDDFCHKSAMSGITIQVGDCQSPQMESRYGCVDADFGIDDARELKTMHTAPGGGGWKMWKGSIDILEDHKIECENSFIASINVDINKGMRFKCASPKDSCAMGVTTRHAGKCFDAVGDGITALADKDAICPEGKAMTSWHLTKEGCSNPQMRIQFACAKLECEVEESIDGWHLLLSFDGSNSEMGDFSSGEMFGTLNADGTAPANADYRIGMTGKDMKASGLSKLKVVTASGHERVFNGGITNPSGFDNTCKSCNCRGNKLGDNLYWHGGAGGCYGSTHFGLSEDGDVHINCDDETTTSGPAITTPSAPSFCDRCTSYAARIDKAADHFCQDPNGKCWFAQVSCFQVGAIFHNLATSLIDGCLFSVPLSSTCPGLTCHNVIPFFHYLPFRLFI
jgi:hypothetical protein